MSTLPHQQGFALLLLLLALTVAAATFFVSARRPAEPGAGNAPGTAVALADARRALLARALADGNRPGSLPCAAPDEGGSGTFNGNPCDAEHGWFPYRTLDTEPPRDVSGARLWYALDGELSDRDSQEPINPEEKPGNLEFDGREGYAAVIMAPGDPLPGQSRTGDTPTDYLEEGNDSLPAFTDCTDVDDCNDRLRAISIDELFDGVQRRVARETAKVLRDFYRDSSPAPASRYLPYTADFGSTECTDDGAALGQLPTTDTDDDCGGSDKVLETAAFPEWMTDNGWLSLVVYHVDPLCTEAERRCGDATLDFAGESVPAVIAVAGRPFDPQGASQDRPGSDVSDYLDRSENADGDAEYIDARLGPANNDVLIGLSLP